MIYFELTVWSAMKLLRTKLFKVTLQQLDVSPGVYSELAHNVSLFIRFIRERDQIDSTYIR